MHINRSTAARALGAALAVLAAVALIVQVSSASADNSDQLVGAAPENLAAKAFTVDTVKVPAGDDVPRPGNRPVPTTTTTVPTTTTTVPPTTTTAPPPPPTTVAPAPAAPPPAPPRSRVDRCWDAINAVVASGLSPAPGFSFECGPAWNTNADGRTPTYCSDGSNGQTCTGTIQIHPDDSDSDAHWRLVVRHEIGHSWCAKKAVDFSEACARAYE